jgi:hypothetical protein
MLTPDMPKSIIKLLNTFTTISWLMPLIAVVEIIDGILFIINKLRYLGTV